MDLLGEAIEWWLDLIEKGNDAHTTLRTHVSGCPGLLPEQTIPSGLERGNGSGYSTPTGKGRVDYLYYNAAGQIEVYELKHDTAYSKAKGQVQLNAYVKAIRENETDKRYKGRTAIQGESLNAIFNCDVPSQRYPNRVIHYHTEAEYPGMIFWSYEKKKKQPQEEMVAVPKDALEWAKNAGLVVVAAGFTVVGLALLADDATGIGTLDNGVAVAFFTKAAQIFKQVFASCPAIN